MLTGNKGEWSELYVFLKLLSEGKLYAADEAFNKSDLFFPVLSVLRKETEEKRAEYKTGEFVKIYINDENVGEIDARDIEREARYLLDELRGATRGSSLAFERTEAFARRMFVFRLAEPPANKSDIVVHLLDVHTGYRPIVGFSIKSELGDSPTLLNAGKTTNFIYRVSDAAILSLAEEQSNYGRAGEKRRAELREKIANLIREGRVFSYFGMEKKVFRDNLLLIDSNMDRIIAETLLYYYRDGISLCSDMVKRLELEDPLSFGNIHAYAYKFKKLLSAVALGMRPATVWNGEDEATGGYIVVTREGEVVAYHLYNRNYFENYLLAHTRYETASTGRHGFGDLYEEDGDSYMKLNLQIRFV
ncbi:HpaII family restriction endonuclease [Selenomonas sp. F0473]|uniref:HpaII family restriction endonuclease n=1 Tax=Selenomonas sp. F0473 TaxID=999423 RepID=UPI00029E4691|nr:HpaII family restriction endonuclease [Selenomonas sp. F0473]EKU71180.1 hypothetical protein HMPREF9161_01274 [Selenomonas sp. F0473]